MEKDDRYGVVRLRRRRLRSANRLVFESDDDIDALADESLRLILGFVRLEVPPD
jgi:hypothetical protein